METAVCAQDIRQRILAQRFRDATAAMFRICAGYAPSTSRGTKRFLDSFLRKGSDSFWAMLILVGRVCVYLLQGRCVFLAAITWWYARGYAPAHNGPMASRGVCRNVRGMRQVCAKHILGTNRFLDQTETRVCAQGCVQTGPAFT